MAKNQQLAVFNAITNNSFVQKTAPKILHNKDIILAFAVLLIIGFLIVPLPSMMLDIFLAISIGASVLITILSLYIKSPLDFSSFPTVLLIVTLFRLALNVASTRLILSSGNPGRIIEAFGSYVIGGNYVVGIIVFIILLIINFLVVIKGSTRIAEVSARFTLDAMPGKQMSIDADLNSGYIDEKTARQRRDNLAHEADFFGSMDGAAKFVKGDAIAGLIITAINIIGGFAVGVLQMDLEVAEAASKFTILSVGDGLVSQIPALLVSVASGLVVTRAAGPNELSDTLADQFTLNPKPLAITGVILFALGLLPGFPTFIFVFLGLNLLILAYFRYASQTKEKETQKVEQERALQAENREIAEAAEVPVEKLLKVDPLEIELGLSLISVVDEQQGGDVFKRITMLRKQLAGELGFIMPPVRVRDNLQLDTDEYVFKIRGNEVARGRIQAGMLLAVNAGNAEGILTGIDVIDPIFERPATWIGLNDRENAEIMGYSVIEPSTILITHFTEVLRQNAAKLLTRQSVRSLIDNLKDDYPVLLDELTVDNFPILLIQKILQNLLNENIPIRDLPIILESVLEYGKITKNVDVLTEYVRHSLSEVIKRMYADGNGVIHAISVAPQLEDKITNALQINTNATSNTLGLNPDTVTSINAKLANFVEEMTTILGYFPLVICSAQIRPYFYRMIHSANPVVQVISYTELPSDTDIDIHFSINE